MASYVFLYVQVCDGISLLQMAAIMAKYMECVASLQDPSFRIQHLRFQDLRYRKRYSFVGILYPRERQRENAKRPVTIRAKLSMNNMPTALYQF